VRARGTQLLQGLKAAFKGNKGVFEVRGQGLFLAVDFDVPTDLAPRFGARVKERAMKNGLMTLGGVGTIDGVNGDCVILAPAYTITPEEADKMVAIVKKSVDECFAEL
jgi:adenosylmethionine-8-amino-7-oxononanoate aminotransferase